MSQDLILLARTPSGDGAFVRDSDGRVWLLGSSGSRLSDHDAVDRAVRDLDFVPVGSTHPDWDDLDRTLQDVIAEWLKSHSSPGIESYSVDTLNEILDDAEEFGGDTFTLATTLLRDCPAARDEAVFGRIVALLQARPAAVTPLRAANNQDAQKRVGLKLAA